MPSNAFLVYILSVEKLASTVQYNVAWMQIFQGKMYINEYSSKPTKLARDSKWMLKFNFGMHASAPKPLEDRGLNKPLHKLLHHQFLPEARGETICA